MMDLIFDEYIYSFKEAENYIFDIISSLKASGIMVKENFTFDLKYFTDNSFIGYKLDDYGNYWYSQEDLNDIVDLAVVDSEKKGERLYTLVEAANYIQKYLKDESWDWEVKINITPEYLRFLAKSNEIESKKENNKYYFDLSDLNSFCYERHRNAMINHKELVRRRKEALEYTIRKKNEAIISEIRKKERKTERISNLVEFLVYTLILIGVSVGLIYWISTCDPLDRWIIAVPVSFLIFPIALFLYVSALRGMKRNRRY